MLFSRGKTILHIPVAAGMASVVFAVAAILVSLNSTNQRLVLLLGSPRETSIIGFSWLFAVLSFIFLAYFAFYFRWVTAEAKAVRCCTLFGAAQFPIKNTTVFTYSNAICSIFAILSAESFRSKQWRRRNPHVLALKDQMTGKRYAIGIVFYLDEMRHHLSLLNRTLQLDIQPEDRKKLDGQIQVDRAIENFQYKSNKIFLIVVLSIIFAVLLWGLFLALSI